MAPIMLHSSIKNIRSCRDDGRFVFDRVLPADVPPRIVEEMGASSLHLSLRSNDLFGMAADAAVLRGGVVHSFTFSFAERAVVEDLTMGELAARWSELLIADVRRSERLTAAAASAGSLLRAPATVQQVEAAESRLGRPLPASYREFLLVSNGAYGDDYGATLVCGDFPEEPPTESHVVGVGFLPVEDVRWLRDAQPWLAEMAAGATDLGDYGPATADGQEPPATTPFADGLQIATDKAPGTTVLIPFDGLSEWQMWNTHKETSVAYLSFRSFLEYEVTEREPVASIKDVQTLIARASAGDHPATMRLSRVVNPDAVPLLVAVVDNPRLGIQPALGLGRIGTPQAIAALMNVNPDVARHAFVVAGTEEARNVLAARGDFESLFELGDPRGFELAAQALAAWDRAMSSWSTPAAYSMRTAVTILSRSGDQRYAEILLPLLAHADQLAQYTAAWALANLGGTEGEHRLERIADTPGSPYRSAAAAYLARYRRARG